MKTNKIIAALTLVAVMAPSMMWAKKFDGLKKMGTDFSKSYNKHQRRNNYVVTASADALAIGLSIAEIIHAKSTVANFFELLTTNPAQAFKDFPVSSSTVVLLVATASAAIGENISYHNASSRKLPRLNAKVAAATAAESKTEGEEFDASTKAAARLETVKAAFDKFEAKARVKRYVAVEKAKNAIYTGNKAEKKAARKTAIAEALKTVNTEITEAKASAKEAKKDKKVADKKAKKDKKTVA